MDARGGRHSTRPLAQAVPVMLALMLAGVGCAKRDRREASAVEPAPNEALVGLGTPVEQAAPALRWYRAELKSGDGVRIPFYLAIPSEGEEGEAEVKVGGAVLRAPVEWRGEHRLRIPFSLFESAIEADVGSDGSLVGTWTQNSSSWGSARLELGAVPVASTTGADLFAANNPASPPSVAGTWRLHMSESEDARLQLWQDDDRGSLRAELLFASGNRATLAGALSGSTLRLAGFDGTSAYLLEAELEAGLLVDGRWLAGAKLDWSESFVGDARAFVLSTGPVVPPPGTIFEVPGIDLSSYRGKPTIVELGGSWCVTCRYAAPFLRSMYERYHEQGLEILTLTYEFTDDEAFNRKRALEFKSEYQLPWKVLPVHGDVSAYEKMMPPSLGEVDVSGFPISVFLRGDGSIAQIHAGFPADRESDAYRQATTEYERHIRELLAATAAP